MKIAVMTGFPAKGDMYINARHELCLLNQRKSNPFDKLLSLSSIN
jgi:hypothetical protein